MRTWRSLLGYYQNNFVTLQIVESSQVGLERWQPSKTNDATHFNPVDLVCGIKNYQNEKFNLKDFVDPDSGFIRKEYSWVNIKAYELQVSGMELWLTGYVFCWGAIDYF
jgi:hypothetical protein